jgi:hypothetical protein
MSMDNKTEYSGDKSNQFKVEIYESLALINRSFEQLIQALYKLEQRLDLGEDFAYHQEIIASDMWTRINSRIIAKLTERESEDRTHYGKLRESLERRRQRN